MESVNLTESLIKFRNVKGGCHLWSGHCTQCWKGKLNETVSVASPIMTSALEHPGDGDVSSGWRWSTSNFVLVFVFFFFSLLQVPLATQQERRGVRVWCAPCQHEESCWSEWRRWETQLGPGLPTRRPVRSLPTSQAKQMTVSSQYWARLMAKFLLPLLDLTHAECSLLVQDDIFKSWRKIQVFLKFHDFHSSPYCYEEQISAVQISKLTHFLVSSLLPFPSE